MNYKRITAEEDLQHAFHIRKSVFLEEQGVPLEDEFDEMDDLDGNCDHILVYHEHQPVGTGRIRPHDGYGKLERICLLEPYRKFGLGKVIRRKGKRKRIGESKAARANAGGRFLS